VQAVVSHKVGDHPTLWESVPPSSCSCCPLFTPFVRRVFDPRMGRPSRLMEARLQLNVLDSFATHSATTRCAGRCRIRHLRFVAYVTASQGHRARRTC
jgi:hypothetical protein